MRGDPLHTRLCEQLGLDVPILLAGMGTISMAELTAAVSEAGGLGFLGGVGLSRKEILDEIEATRGLTDAPFGVDLFLPDPASVEQLREGAAAAGTPVSDERLEGLRERLDVRPTVQAILEAGVAYFASALGNPGWMVDDAHEAGTRVLALVGTVRQAVACEQAGVDVIVAQGYDAGGHTGRVGTFSLVPQVVDAVDVPVVAAGGIVDGRGVAAALALGAEGVWMGSRFVASREAQAAAAHKRRISEIGDEGTTITRAYTGKTARMIKNRYIEQWEGHEDAIKPFPLQMLESQRATADRDPEDPDWMPMPAGQASGLIRQQAPPAAEIVADVADEAREVLTRIGRA